MDTGNSNQSCKQLPSGQKRFVSLSGQRTKEVRLKSMFKVATAAEALIAARISFYILGKQKLKNTDQN